MQQITKNERIIQTKYKKLRERAEWPAEKEGQDCTDQEDWRLSEFEGNKQQVIRARGEDSWAKERIGINERSDQVNYQEQVLSQVHISQT